MLPVGRVMAGPFDVEFGTFEVAGTVAVTGVAITVVFMV